MYFDKYTMGKYGAVSSTDLKNWQDISDKVTFPKGARHGTVFTISNEEFQTLLARTRWVASGASAHVLIVQEFYSLIPSKKE